MPVQKFVSEKIQVGVSDYVGVGTGQGSVEIFTLKEVDPPLPDWKNSYEETISVTSSYSTSFVVPALHNFKLKLKKLSTNDEHLVSLSSSGTDINYPDVIVKNFEGTLPYSNKTVIDQTVVLTITPISSHETSSYKINFDPVYEWPMVGKNCVLDESKLIISEYPTGRSGPYAVWDQYRHMSVKLDFTFGYANAPISAHKTLIANSFDSEAFVLPNRFDEKGISKVDILLTLTVEDPTGEYSVIPKKSNIPSDVNTLYDIYKTNREKAIQVIDERKFNAGQDISVELENISSNDTTTATSSGTSGTSGTSGGY